jgi:hypothetical protein
LWEDPKVPKQSDKLSVIYKKCEKVTDSAKAPTTPTKKDEFALAQEAAPAFQPGPAAGTSVINPNFLEADKSTEAARQSLYQSMLPEGRSAEGLQTTPVRGEDRSEIRYSRQSPGEPREDYKKKYDTLSLEYVRPLP